MAAGISAVLALGCLAMAIAHAGVEIPGLSAIGPGGDQVVIPAVIAFSVAAVLLAVLTLGLWQRRPWAWAAGLAVHGVVLAGSAMPYRGVGSLIGILLAGTAFVLLASPAGRDAVMRGA